MLTKRLKFLLAVLFLCAGAWAGNALHIGILRADAARFGNAMAQSFLDTAKEPETEAAPPVVYVTKPFVIFGRPEAKVTVYIRFPYELSPGDPERNIAPLTVKAIAGVEYRLAREKGEWVELESASCSERECAEEGAEAFAAAGL